MHIVLADDHKLVAEALQAYLTKLQPDIVVSRAEDYHGAREYLAQKNNIDMVILDLNMPGMNGLEGLSLMRAEYPDTPVVLLSGLASNEQIREAMERGASGFIPKNLSGKAMLGALDLVLAGEHYVPSAILMERHGGASNASEAGSPLNALTDRESQVLTLLIRGYSNKKIAQDLGLKEITAAFHLKGVFKKLGVSNRTEAVVSAIRQGWSF